MPARRDSQFEYDCPACAASHGATYGRTVRIMLSGLSRRLNHRPGRVAPRFAHEDRPIVRAQVGRECAQRRDGPAQVLGRAAVVVSELVAEVAGAEVDALREDLLEFGYVG